jgi:ribose transport system substrate-binding protein
MLRRELLRFLVASAALASSAASFGCRQKRARVVAGFSQMANVGAWRIAETSSMRQAAAERPGYELIVTDAQDSTAKQIGDVEDLVARRVDALFIAPREYYGIEPALESAKRAKVPVFFIDRAASGTPGVDFVTFLGSDFVAQGRRAGEWLARACSGHASIMELSGTPGASVARERAQGFREALRGHPDMRIIGSQSAEFVRATALRAMENALQGRGRGLTAVFAHNDEMALGAIQAIRSAGLRPGSDVTVVSIDGERLALEAILRGELGATVESNPRFGPLALGALERFLRGEVLPPRIILEDRLFDITNAAAFVDEAY